MWTIALKGKGKKELKDLAEEIQAGKLATQRLVKELLLSKDLEVISKAYAVAQ